MNVAGNTATFNAFVHNCTGVVHELQTVAGHPVTIKSCEHACVCVDFEDTSSAMKTRSHAGATVCKEPCMYNCMDVGHQHKIKTRYSYSIYTQRKLVKT